MAKSNQKGRILKLTRISDALINGYGLIGRLYVLNVNNANKKIKSDALNSPIHIIDKNTVIFCSYT